MKNPVTYLMVVLVLGVASMVGLHGWEIRSLQAKGAQIETFASRQAIASQMILEMEKYRRLSKEFRKLSDPQIEKSKDQLVETIAEGVSKLEALSPAAEEKQIDAEINAKIGDFMALSAQLEPQLFLRDVFVKEPARDLYESIIGNVDTLRKNAETRVAQSRAELTRPFSGSTRLMLIAAGLSLAMGALLLLRNYLAFVRPIRALRSRSKSFALNHTTPASEIPSSGSKKLKGAYGEIETVLSDLSQTVESLRKERHQFVTAIASDLRAPLVALQSGACFLSSASDRATDAERRSAAEVVHRSLFRLNATLDDLSDIVEIERSEIRLNEKIVDIRSVVTEVAHQLGGTGSSHEVCTQLPTMPIWAMIDPIRFERMLVHLVSKSMSFMPQGGRIDVSMNRSTRGSFRGLEIVIQDAERISHGRGAPTGPEQDLLRHWVSANGFGMALVKKVVNAHGGMVTASGVAGSGVVLTIRLPQERLGTGVVTDSSANSATALLEGAGITSMFAEQAMNFGS